MRMFLPILLLAALPLFAQDQPLDEAIAAARANQALYVFCHGDDPLGAVCNAVSMKGTTAAEVIRRVAERLAVSRDSARAIVTAITPILRGSPEPLEPAVRRAGEAALTEALARERNRVPLIAALAHLAGASTDREAAMETLLPLIGNDVRATVAAADAIGSEQLLVLGYVYQRDPENVKLVEAIASRAWHPHVRAAIGPLRLTMAGAELRKGAGDAEAVVMQLRALADLGLPRLLIAAYEALTPALQAKLLRKSEAAEDVRPDLAAAALLTGKSEIARRFTAAVRTPATDDDRDGGMRALLEAAAGAKADPFDVIVAQFSNAFTSSFIGVRGQLLARFAERHGYAAFAAEVRVESERPRRYELPETFRDATAIVRQHIDDSGPAASIASPAASAPSSLAAPRIVPFTERRLAGVASSITPTVIDCGDAEHVARTTNLPPDVSPIRMERQGDDVVAVVLSTAVDPVGEIGLGGYWILRSTDGGASWREYYTGLRQNMPYVVPPSSRLPLVDGDRLRIEVEVKELDTSSITFPPLGLRLARSERGLYLDFPWAELVRDSDGDGLTDLLEERLTTDANELDTDGDGIADGEDHLPRVPRHAAPSVAAEVLATALSGFRLGGGAIVEGIGEGEDRVESLQQSCEIRASVAGEAVLFVEGDPALFGPLTTGRRTIVLTPAEVQAYTAKFGPIYPAAIRHFVIDPTGTRALIELDESWAGSTYLVQKTSEGGWNVTVLSSWIS